MLYCCLSTYYLGSHLSYTIVINKNKVILKASKMHSQTDKFVELNYLLQVHVPICSSYYKAILQVLQCINCTNIFYIH
jgi:hypothetical protein